MDKMLKNKAIIYLLLLGISFNTIELRKQGKFTVKSYHLKKRGFDFEFFV